MKNTKEMNEAQGKKIKGNKERVCEKKKGEEEEEGKKARRRKKEIEEGSWEEVELAPQ